MKLSSKIGRVSMAMATLFVALVSVLVVPPASQVSAAGEIAVAITRDTPIPVRSGLGIVYTLFAECSATNEAACEGMVATIPLPNEIVSATVSASSYIDSVSFVRGTGLTVDFKDVIPAGTSISVQVTLATENFTTPDGFTWMVPATLVANGVSPVEANPPADGQVSAVANLGVDKDYVFKELGAVPLDTPVTYTIRVCDTVNGLVPGMLGLETGTLVDTLPEGAIYVSSSNEGQYDPTAHTVTWNLDGFQPTWCNYSPPVYTVEVEYPSTLFGPESGLVSNPNLIIEVTNTVRVDANAYGAPNPEQALFATDFVEHLFTDDVGPIGHFAKNAPTPTTHAGEWSAGYEATWGILHAGGLSPHGVEIHDRLPCATPFAGPPERSAHVSPVDGEQVCDTPTFILEQITIVMDPAANPAAAGYQTAIALGWRPRWVSTENTTGDFLPQVGNTFVPPADITVAEVVFPFHPSIIFPAAPAGLLPPFITLNGHMIDDQPGDVFADAPDGAPVKNRADFTLFSPEGTPGSSASEYATIRVIPESVIAEITKQLNPSADPDYRSVVLTVVNWGGRPIENVVVTDLLPAGIYHRSPFPPIVTVVGNTNVTYEYDKIDNYNNTGRQLMRITLVSPSLGSGLAGSLRVSFPTYGYASLTPGGIVNTAEMFVNGSAADDLDGCRNGDANTAPPLTSDPDDLDRNGVTQDDRYCQAAATSQRLGTDVVLTARKLVKGDLDNDFVGFPSVGSVDSGAQSSGQFRLELTNRSGVELVNAVIYDVLPTPGDTGVRTSAARGSAYRPTLTEVPTVVAPSASAVIEYSTASIPCRGEVRSLARNAWPANCVDDWSTTAPDPLSSVTAIRVSGLGALPAGSLTPNVTITLTVAVPDTAKAGDVAWNSFAVAADRADNNQPILPTEPPKVGLARPLTDVELDKTVNGEKSVTVAVGETVTYRITARHGTTVTTAPDGGIVFSNPAGSAPSTARDVVVADAVPSGMALVAGSATNCNQGPLRGMFDEATGRWSVGDIRPGDSFDLCFQATVTGMTLTAIRNVAEVFAVGQPEDIDSTPGNMPSTGPHDDEDDEDDAEVIPAYPQLTVAKSVVADPVQPVYVSGNTFSAEYLISVVNAGNGAGTYSLVDTPMFAGSMIERVEVSTDQGPAVDIDESTGLDEVEIVTGQAISPNTQHVFRVKVTFAVDPATAPADRQCDSPDVAGQGAYNRATVTTGGTSLDDDACVDIPPPSLSVAKSAVSLTRTPDTDFGYTAKYSVTVANSGDGPGRYSLAEVPQFGAGATITGVTVAPAAGTPGSPVSSTTSPVQVATDQSIERRATHTYDVAVNFVVAPDMAADQALCAAGRPSHGAFNQATLIVGSLQNHADACLDIPIARVTLAKTAGSLTRVPESLFRYAATYTVTVTNTGDGPGLYSLEETPVFGDGATISSITVEPAAGTPGGTVTSSSGSVTVATDRVIVGGGTHTYLVTVTFSVAGAMADDERACVAGEPGEGAFNRAVLTVVNAVSNADACLDIPLAEVSMEKTAGATEVTPLPGFVFEARYRLTVRNTGSGPGAYTLSDTPAFGPGATITNIAVVNADDNTPAVDMPNETSFPVAIVTDQAIAGGATHVYDVTVAFTVAAGMTPAARACDDSGAAGSGAFNGATIRVGLIESSDAACIDIPNGDVIVHKTVHAQTFTAPDKVTVTYEITVANNTTAPTRYSLADRFAFDESVTVDNRSISSAPAGVALSDGFTGVAPGDVIAADVAINGGVVHTYQVTAEVTVDLDSVPEGVCAGAGSGLFNTASVTAAGITSNATACAPFSTLQLVKQVVNDDGGNAEVDDFVLAANGPSLTAGSGTSGVTWVIPGGGYTLAEVQLAAYTASGWSCDGGVVAGDIVTVTPGANAVCTIVNDDQPASRPSNADLAIVKTSSTGLAAPGAAVRWQLAIVNNGPATALNVVITDVVPASMTVIGVASSDFTCTRNANSVSCTVASLAPGAHGTVSIDATINAITPGGTITNTGRVTSDTPDPVPSNNTDDAGVTIVVQAPPVPTPPDQTPARQPLPRTGTDLTLQLLRAGLVIFFIGAVALASSRRRRWGAINS